MDVVTSATQRQGPDNKWLALFWLSVESPTRRKPLVPSVSFGDYVEGGSGSCFPGWRHCSGNRLGCHGYSSPGPGPAHFQAASLSACMVPAVTRSLSVSGPLPPSTAWDAQKFKFPRWPLSPKIKPCACQARLFLETKVSRLKAY